MNVVSEEQGGGARWRYWPEIDGLRTVAVTSVFLFHLHRAILPGGFVGVDVFFVISGFLISSILLDDIAGNKFSIGNFYQRRISRIFPALITVVLATITVGYFIYSAQDFASLGINGAAAVLSIINFKLMSQGSYFLVSADAQPLLHYWSLAVEEQFYIVFPILLYAIMRNSRRPLSIMLGIASISFLMCVLLTATRPTFAFYMLPTRAWELLVGSSLALYRSRGARLGVRGAAASTWAGAALVGVAVATLNEGAGFPGWVAAVPVGGAALIIAASGDARPWPLRILAQRWMVAIGKRSYSLYLWHWPVFSFVDYGMFQSNFVVRLVVKVLISLGLTELSYRYVERTSRSYLNVPWRRYRLFAATATVVALVAVGGVWLRKSFYFDVPPRLIASGGFVVSGGSRGVILLSGDSEAAMYGTELGSIAKKRDLTLYAVAAAGKNQLPGAAGTSWPAVQNLIEEKKPDIVILVNNWTDKLVEPAPLRQAIAAALRYSRHVILITQPPILPDNVSRERIRDGLPPPYYEPAEMRRKRLAAQRIVESFASNRVSVLNVANIFTAVNGEVKVVAPDGRLAFFDSRHLSDSGTAMTHSVLDVEIIKHLQSR